MGDQLQGLGRATFFAAQPEDFSGGTADNPWDNFKPDYMDQSCLDPEWVIGQPGHTDADRFLVAADGLTRTCAMFNMDNCFECARQLGHVCTQEDFYEPSLWNCNDPDVPDSEKAACTGIGGLDKQIHWLVGMAPPPGMRLWATDSRVHIFWDDLSLITKDIRLQKIDFESFRIWRADNWERPYGSSVVNGPESSLWQMIGEYDRVNSYVQSRRRVAAESPLRCSTRFPWAPTPALIPSPTNRWSLARPEFTGLLDSMQVVVDMDPQGVRLVRPEVRGPKRHGERILPDHRPLGDFSRGDGHRLGHDPARS